jgi:hypothetical protein
VAALRTARETGDRYDEAQARYGLARALTALGDRATAAGHVREAAELFAAVGAPEAAEVTTLLSS